MLQKGKRPWISSNISLITFVLENIDWHNNSKWLWVVNWLLFEKCPLMTLRLLWLIVFTEVLCLLSSDTCCNARWPCSNELLQESISELYFWKNFDGDFVGWWSQRALGTQTPGRSQEYMISCHSRGYSKDHFMRLDFRIAPAIWRVVKNHMVKQVWVTSYVLCTYLL